VTAVSAGHQLGPRTWWHERVCAAPGLVSATIYRSLLTQGGGHAGDTAGAVAGVAGAFVGVDRVMHMIAQCI